MYVNIYIDQISETTEDFAWSRKKVYGRCTKMTSSCVGSVWTPV